MNNYNGNFNNEYPNMFNKSFEQQLQTNKWKVQNLQDALTRYAPPNSCGCYHCVIDSEEYEYEIYTDQNGQKSYKVFKRIPCETNTQNVSIEEILNRLKSLEEKINVKSTANSNDGSTKM